MNRTVHKTAGFTLIETLVSLGIFAIVVTIVVGSLLVLVSGNQRVQAEQSVITNLTFALDSMTREIRTGTHYNCNSSNAPSSDTLFATQESFVLATRDCVSGNNTNHRYQGISFREGGSSIGGTNDRIAYFYDSDGKTIRRRVGDSPSESIVSTDIEITRAEFFVSGSTPLSTGGGGGNTEQPTVTITIEAKDKTDANAKPFIVQTTVTQRALDI